MKTKQTEFWKGVFGREYTDRNLRNPSQREDFYIQNWGESRVQMNNEFIGSIPREASILEVGCNAGMQLTALESMGFKRIYGLELLAYAAKKAKEFVRRAHIVVGSGLELPFKDGSFDLVCTNVVLIHIAPVDLGRMMNEMYRCSKKYIWGFEYYCETPSQIRYRGNNDVLWKADFAGLFLKQFPDLKLVKRKLYPYIKKEETGNVDCMYLLEKGERQPHA